MATESPPPPIEDAAQEPAVSPEHLSKLTTAIDTLATTVQQFMSSQTKEEEHQKHTMATEVQGIAYKTSNEPTTDTNGTNGRGGNVNYGFEGNGAVVPANGDAGGGKMDFSQDENEERGNWSGKLDFLLSCLGYAVGLGNVWRFPYLCYRNGGGAFFIPYVIMLVFVGMPIFFMELSLGQFTSSGPLTCWKFAPIFSGIGIGMVIVSSMVAIYYNMIIAYSLFYLFASFTSYLPWQDCDKSWNNEFCFKNMPDVNCSSAFSELIAAPNGTCYNVTVNNTMTFIGLWNETAASEAGIQRQSPSEQYYNNYVLGLSDDVGNLGQIKWQLLLCLLLAWIIVFLCLCKGVKSSGKVVYFTALFPYLVLVILFVRGVTLDGCYEGIIYYITPQWDRLADARVWNDAANQIFFSLSTCWGGLITLSSYNRFHNNCLKDTLIVTLSNCLTSIFAGFVIFSFLGFMAKEMGTTVDKVATGGTGLAFIVYPDAVSRMPVSPLWSILFFIMLLTLGLDSQFALLETVVTSLLDKVQSLRKKKTWVILGVSVVFFILGLPLTTNGGAYILQLMDSYAGGWAVLLLAILETVSISWVYGYNRFCNDIYIMIGSRPVIWWRICWQFLTPLVICFVLVFAWVDYKPASYGDYDFPLWANGVGWAMTVVVILGIPIVAVYHICKAEGSFLERLRTAARPSRHWGPALEKHRMLVDYAPGFLVNPDKDTFYDLSSMPTKELGTQDNPAFVGDRY